MKVVTHNKIVEKCHAHASEKLLKKEELNRVGKQSRVCNLRVNVLRVVSSKCFSTNFEQNPSPFK